MANIIITPDMNLSLPVVGVQFGPQYASNINDALTLVDSHDHTPGFGVQITPAGLNINSTLTINNNLITNIAGLTLTAQSVTPGISTVYESGNDLFFVDRLGNNIQITQNGGIAGSPGSISNLTSPASAAYISGSSTFVWQSNTNIAANMDFGSAILRNLSPNSTFGLTLQPPAALSSNFALTLPTVPGNISFLQIDTSGVITAQTATSILVPSNPGTQGQYLRQNASLQPIYQNLLQNIQTKTSTYAITGVDDIVFVSGGIFTVTLPSAIGIAGKQIIIKKTDPSLTNIITIATTLAQTIDGATTVTLNTVNETYILVSDGANYQVLEHKTKTPVVTTTSTITATTTNPTKGATPVDSVTWYRDGIDMVISWTYYQQAAGSAGVGAYLFTIPSSLVLDSSVNIASGTIDQTHIGLGGTALGNGYNSNNVNAGSGVATRFVVVPFSTTKLYFIAEFPGSASSQGESVGTGQGIGFATTPYYITFTARLPIAGWSA